MRCVIFFLHSIVVDVWRGFHPKSNQYCIFQCRPQVPHRSCLLRVSTWTTAFALPQVRQDVMTGLLARIVGTRFDRAWVIETMTKTRKLEITRPRVSCALVTCFRAKRLHCCFFWIKSSTWFSVVCNFIFLASYLWIILNLTDGSVNCRLWVCQVHSCSASFLILFAQVWFWYRRWGKFISRCLLRCWGIQETIS